MEERDERMFWQLVFAASIMSGGKSVQGATSNADQAIAAYKARFPRKERDDD